jgi:hypothetical protein
MKRTLASVTIAMAGMIATVGQGCRASGVGDPCIPDREYSADFSGFSLKEVSIESKSFQCQTRICLVNHFRGRVSCPAGQDKTGASLPGAKDANGTPSTNCEVPGTDKVPVTGPVAADGSPSDSKHKKCVQSQCSKRQPTNAVYCSCRCANVNGRNDDGKTYCACPDGFACEQLVSSTGRGDEGLTGGYCIKSNTKYEEGTDPCGPNIDNGVSAAGCPD